MECDFSGTSVEIVDGHPGQADGKASSMSAVGYGEVPTPVPQVLLEKNPASTSLVGFVF